MRTLAILIMTAATALAQAAPQQAPAAFEKFDRFVGLTADIDKLTVQLADLRKRYTDSHPDVRELRTRLEGLQAQLRAERDRAPQQDLAKELRDEIEARVRQRTFQVQTTSSGRLPDNWWRATPVVNTLRLTVAQVRQMEEIFQQHRLKLIDLNAALEKEEVTLEPLVSADKLDEGKLTAQIDRVAQARAELEKSRGRMLVGIRKVLETEQWRKLSEMGFTVTSR